MVCYYYIAKTVKVVIVLMLSEHENKGFNDTLFIAKQGYLATV